MTHRAMSCCVTALLALTAAIAFADDGDRDDHSFHTATPIKHLVVIFQENVSFDHYFGTYPIAQNNSGETPFTASSRTPKSINTLLTPLDVNNGFKPLTGVDLINNNPNNNPNAPVARTTARRTAPAPAIPSGWGQRKLWSPIRATTTRPKRKPTTTSTWTGFQRGPAPPARRQARRPSPRPPV